MADWAEAPSSERTECRLDSLIGGCPDVGVSGVDDAASLGRRRYCVRGSSPPLGPLGRPQYDRVQVTALGASMNANRSVNAGRSFFAYRLADRSFVGEHPNDVRPLPVATVRHSASCSPTDRFAAVRSCDTLV